MASPISRSSTIKSTTARYTAASPASENPLTSLVRRLEAATSRLEDIASSAASGFDSAERGSHHGTSPGTPVPASSSAPELAGMAKGLDTTSSPPVPAESLPPSIKAMDELLEKDLSAFVDASKPIDPLVHEQAQAVAKAFADQRRFLLVTTRAKKPDMNPETFGVLLKDLQQDMGAVGDVKDMNRGSPMKDHLSMVGDGIGVLQWLIMDGKPADYVKETIGGAQMYGNRVLTKYKEKDPTHVRFVQSYYTLLKSLQSYISTHYANGVTWNNSTGKDAVDIYREVASASEGAPPAPAPSGSTGAPPPPPPPLPNFDHVPSPAPPPPGGAPVPKAPAGDMGAVFEQLNRGSAVTAGLKKVDKSQMTHKNPSLRAQSGSGPETSRSKSPGPDVKPKPQSMRQNSTASTKSSAPAAGKKTLDGNKWYISHHDSPSQPLTVEVSLTQSLLISACKNTTIILKGKANAVSIDNCSRLQILLDSLVSSVDVIKSPNFALQVTGTCPTVLLDQVDGASIYLGRESLATEVFTSKCSSVNIVLPPAGELDDSKECPLPEQMRTVIRDGKLVSEIVEHAG